MRVIALLLLAATSACVNCGCSWSGAPASVLRYDEYQYEHMKFIATTGSESRPDYVYAVDFVARSDGKNPVLFRGDHVIDVSLDTKSDLAAKFPSREVGGRPTLRVDDDILVDYKDNTIVAAYATKTKVAANKGSEPLTLPCSLDALTKHFGKPKKVRKQ